MTTHLTPDQTSQIDLDEHQLHERLSKIMRKPPKCRKHSIAYKDEHCAAPEHNELMEALAVPSENHFADVDDTYLDDSDAAPFVDQSIDNEPIEPAHIAKLRETTIVKTTRRARFRSGAMQVSSWIITIAVIAFITGCAAVILFGIPKNFDLESWITTRAKLSTAPATPKSLKVNTVQIKVKTPAR